MCGAWLKEGGADVEGLQKPIWRHDMLPMTWQKDQNILFFRKYMFFDIGWTDQCYKLLLAILW